MASETQTLRTQQSKAADTARPTSPAPKAKVSNPKVVVADDQPLPVRKSRAESSNAMATATSRGVSGQTAADESVDEASEFELQPDVFEDVPEPPATRASGDQDGFEQATVVRLFKELNYDPPVDDEFDGRHT